MTSDKPPLGLLKDFEGANRALDILMGLIRENAKEQEIERNKQSTNSSAKKDKDEDQRA